MIDDHLADPRHERSIRQVMLEHFRDDWEAIVAGGFHLEIEQFISRRRALVRETLRGDFVKSHGEKVIANALFEHGLDYAYELHLDPRGRQSPGLSDAVTRAFVVAGAGFEPATFGL
ncbi:MAG: hypothetical protein RIB98_13695 [Acidimicrobiales bacterium]